MSNQSTEASGQARHASSGAALERGPASLPDPSAMLALGTREDHDALIALAGNCAQDSRTVGWLEQLLVSHDGSYPMCAPIPASLVDDVEQVVDRWAEEVDANGEGLHTAVHRAVLLAWPSRSLDH